MSTLNQQSADAISIYLADIPLSVAVRAFHGTSHSPERRGASMQKDYAATLAADKETFIAAATKGGTLHLVEEEFARYRAGYRQRYLAYLASSSRCVSSFIAGPSNFPARRMNKRADIAHNRAGELIAFRERALRAIQTTLRPDLRPIYAGDADALERLTKEVVKLEQVQSRMKSANAAIRKHAKAGAAAQIAALVELGFSDAVAPKLLEKDFCGRIGFADYELTNNGANIRRIRARIKEVEARAGWETTEVTHDTVTVREDVEANRIMLMFPAKPDASTRALLKAHAFKWSRSNEAWQRFLNAAGKDAAATIVARLSATTEA